MSIDPDNFINAGTLNDVDGGVFVSVTANFTNSGTIAIGSGGSMLMFANGNTLTNSGVIKVVGGSLDMQADTSGGGMILVSSGGVADVGNVAGTVGFGDTNGTVLLANAGAFTGSISGFAKAPGGVTRDTIDLQGTAVTTIDPYVGTTAGGTLTLEYNTSVVAQLFLVGDYTTAHFTFAPDSNGGYPGTDIFTDHVACFAAGTRILTERGEVAVEDLHAGDRVRSLILGGYAPVRWIGHRQMDLRASPQARPVRIAAGAFGAGLPRRDLLVSPEHALYIDGVLVPARHLVNGRSIAIDAALQSVAYFHVELPAHDVLLAEGLAVESWLDTGNRAMFENAVVTPLQRRGGTIAPPPCAPRVEHGPRLAAIRARLAAVALALGYSPVREMTLEIDAPGMLQFAVPAGVELVRLRSGARTNAPDVRRLGVLVSEIMFEGRNVELSDACLDTGFHLLERHGERIVRWTDGDARMMLRAAAAPRVLTVTVAALAGEPVVAKAA